MTAPVPLATSAVRKAYVDTPAGQLHLRRVEGGGIPVILLHRTPSSSRCYERVLAEFAGRRTAIALDTPGFGESFRPSGKPSTVDYAHWFLAAIDGLGLDAFHLCAHHTGTHFAAEIARLAPQRARSLLLSGALFTDAGVRGWIRSTIAAALPPDPDGHYVDATWKIIRGLYPQFHAEIVHADLLGALGAIEGRDQAFNAILAQDFPGVLRQVRCPVTVAQAVDDPLGSMLARLRIERPDIPVERLGLAGMAAPELQPHQFAQAALRFAAANDSSHLSAGLLMTDRRFQLVRTPTGLDLEQVRAAPPVPGPGEVLIRVHAASLNRRDLDIRSFAYPTGDADRFVPLSDAAGEIVGVGAGVGGFHVGDRVCSTFFQDWADGRIGLPALFSALGGGGRGVLADHIVLSEKGVAKMPDGWSYEQGACLPCAGVTAWSALMRFGQLQAGDWVLVTGTGGVAMFALQIAVAMGAKVAITSSSDEKLARAKELGATVAVNYRNTPDWGAAIKAATGGGVQHAIELGGVGTLPQSIASMGLAGHVSLIGALAGFGGEVPGAAMVLNALRVSAVVVGPRAAHLELAAFMAKHGLKPVIDRVFDADAVPQAYARAAAGAFGKVVIRLR